MRISDWSSDVCSSDLLDPMAMFGGEAAIRARARKVIDDFGVIGNGGHVFNLGHGISRFTRSAERRVRKTCVSTCRSRWSTDHSQKKHSQRAKTHLHTNESIIVTQITRRKQSTK